MLIIHFQIILIYNKKEILNICFIYILRERTKKFPLILLINYFK